MKMTLEQKKLVRLTMELDLKAREYKALCKILEDFKATNIDSNSNELELLLKQFEKNQKEIIKIQKELQALQNINK